MTKQKKNTIGLKSDEIMMGAYYLVDVWNDSRIIKKNHLVRVNGRYRTPIGSTYFKVTSCREHTEYDIPCCHFVKFISSESNYFGFT